MSDTDTKSTEAAPAPAHTSKPSKADLAAARAKAKPKASNKSFTQPGAVLGVDAAWKTYVIDKNLPPERIKALQLELEAAGWSKCEPSPTVVGFDSTEVWRIPKQVFDETHFAQRKKRDDAARRNLRINGAKARQL